MAMDSTKSDRFWFEDGSIILNVRTTQFRVHRGILSRHAKVFRDMTSMPQPQTEEEPLIEGCPVIALDDDPKDWENLLSIMYDYNTSYLSRETFELPFLASALRLGRKYEFDNLYDTALERIKLSIPDTLEEWDEFHHNSGSTLRSDGMQASQSAIDLLNLLLELDIGALLPAAYYICLNLLGIRQIFRGIARSDGSTATLSPASIETLLVGKDRILHSYYFIAFLDASIPSEDCLSEIDCSEKANILRLCWPYPHAEQALASWERNEVDHFCTECQKQLVDLRLPHRRKIWVDLPHYFGLE